MSKQEDISVAQHKELLLLTALTYTYCGLLGERDIRQSNKAGL